jgi:hypothetical protein
VVGVFKYSKFTFKLHKNKVCYNISTAYITETEGSFYNLPKYSKFATKSKVKFCYVFVVCEPYLNPNFQNDQIRLFLDSGYSFE